VRWADRKTAGLTAALVGVALAVGSSAPARANVTATTATAAKAATSVTPMSTLSVLGHGFGHGRGMSQYGAYGAALKGLSYSSILAFYYSGTTLTTETDPTMRVEISADNDNSTKVYPATGLALCYDGSTRFALSTNTLIHAWRLARSGSTLILQYYENGAWATSGLKLSGSSATFTRSTTCSNYGSSTVTLVLPSGAVEGIRGGARGALYSTGVRSVGVMSMTNYLYGVVASEMPASWAAQALNAQSVAARTYAAHYRQVIGATTPWDICDSTSCQVFHGTEGETSTSDAAVLATAGKVLTYHGALAETEFSASNGGETVAGGEPYLVAKADPYDGVAASYPHSWTDTISASSLERAYPSVGTVTSVRVLSRDGHGSWGGRTESVQVIGSSGSVTVSGSSFASAAGLLSIWWVVPTPVAGDLSGDSHPDLLMRETGTGVMRVYDGDGAGGFLGEQSRGSGWQAYTDIMLPGDVNGDGRPDVVAMRKSDGSLWMYPGDGKGWVVAPTQIGSHFNIFSTLADVGDDTGDGKADLAGVDAATGDLMVYSLNGASGFRSGSIRVGSGWGIFDAIVGVGDLDGDGIPDLVARVKTTGQLRLYRGTGSGGYHPGVTLAGSYAGYTLLASPGDWNGDGRPDLLAVNPATGRLTMFPGTGSGATAGFGPAQLVGGEGWGIFDSMS
jgi:stage II sporulation protein D